VRRRAAALLGAAALDLLVGEPPAQAHPVVWLGRAISLAERTAPRGGHARQLTWGAVLAGGLPLVAALVSGVAGRVCRRCGPAGVLAEAAMLKPAFALGALVGAGGIVRRALDLGDLARAREELRSLVSRDTGSLDGGLVAAAAIESLAENLTDSVLAPWLAYVAFGLPGAYAYRAVNTLDSMIGYHGRYEYLGKAAARLDDLLNCLPARVGAVLLAAAAPAGLGSCTRALRTALRDAQRTASPNAGWTMAAMAGALGVRLEKVGAYALGDGRIPDSVDIARAQRIVLGAAGLALMALALGLGRRA
jgi:adenosylcobinamide-phosphate synthase